MTTIALTDLPNYVSGPQENWLRSNTTRRVRRHLAFAIGVERRLRAIWMRYIAWHVRRATRVALDGLDARTLRDIGIDRSEIESVVRDLDVMLAWHSRAARRQYSVRKWGQSRFSGGAPGVRVPRRSENRL